jgi:hypothetical protein
MIDLEKVDAALASVPLGPDTLVRDVYESNDSGDGIVDVIDEIVDTSDNTPPEKIREDIMAGLRGDLR